MKKIWISVVAGSLIAASGCAAAEVQNDSTTDSAHCDDGEFTWTTAKKWRLVVLDDPVSVAAGSTFEAKSVPHRPRKALATAPGNSLKQSTIFESLSRHLGKKVAKPHLSTTSESRKMSATFPEKGQAVYYRGVKEVTASYTHACSDQKSGTSETSGKIFTWETDSSTTGLIDCLVGPKENSQSRLARMAISQRCPEGTPAREVLEKKETP